MYRIDNSSAATTLAAPTTPGAIPNGFFQEGNPSLGIDATILEAEWLNMVQEEVSNVITANGLGAAGGAADLNKDARNQLLTAIRREVANGVSGQIPDVSNFVHKTGDVMSGNLTVPGLIATTLHVSGTGIQYTDTHTYRFTWDGSLMAFYVDGTSQGHVAAREWTSANFATIAYCQGTFLPFSGGTISGNLSVSNHLDVGGGGINTPGGVTATTGLFAGSDQLLSLYTSADGTRFAQFINGFSLQLLTPAVSGFDWTFDIQRYGATWTQWRGSDMTFFNALAAVGGAGAYFQVSDARTKEDIAPETRGLDVVCALEPRSFRRIARADRALFDREVGFIAQEVRDVLPEAVAERSLADTEDDAPLLVTTLDPIVAALVNATKEIAGRLVALEAKS
jgi:hypothetical protein